jgi:hypothetical protein
MTKKYKEDYCMQYHTKKLCQEASGRLFTRSITLGAAESVKRPRAESNHEPTTSTERRAYVLKHEHARCTTDAPVVYHRVFVIHHGHMLTVYTVYLRAKIGVIYSMADAYATGLFIDLQSFSVCMQSGLYFPNPREFWVLNIFLSFVAYSIFLQVCFVHNFCNLTDIANLYNGNLGNYMSNICTSRLQSWRRSVLGRKRPLY